MHRKWTCSLIVSGLAAASLCQAALEPTSQAATTETDEIVVRGTPIYALREALIAAEDRFYARYNELNKVRDFDVECVVAPPTGSRLKERICLTKLQRDAMSAQGYEFVKWVVDQGSGETGAPGGMPGLRGAPPETSPQAVVLARYQEYKENVLYLLKMNPDLRRLVRERRDAEKRLDAERLRRFKERWLAIN